MKKEEDSADFTLVNAVHNYLLKKRLTLNSKEEISFLLEGIQDTRKVLDSMERSIKHEA